jgi:nucleoid DNA-binding protein
MSGRSDTVASKGALRHMSTITKKDLIDRIADQTGQKRTVVKQTIQSFLDTIINELSDGNRLEFRDFGVFETKERAPRTAQNPKTLERVFVPAKKTVKFKVGRLMQVRVDGDIPAKPEIKIVGRISADGATAADGRAVR